MDNTIFNLTSLGATRPGADNFPRTVSRLAQSPRRLGLTALAIVAFSGGATAFIARQAHLLCGGHF